MDPFARPAHLNPRGRNEIRYSEMQNPGTRALFKDEIAAEERRNKEAEAEWRRQQAEQQREQAERADFERRTRNSQIEQFGRETGREFYGDAFGNLQWTHDDETWQARRGEQRQARDGKLRDLWEKKADMERKREAEDRRRELDRNKTLRDRTQYDAKEHERAQKELSEKRQMLGGSLEADFRPIVEERFKDDAEAQSRAMESIYRGEIDDADLDVVRKLRPDAFRDFDTVAAKVRDFDGRKKEYDAYTKNIQAIEDIELEMDRPSKESLEGMASQLSEATVALDASGGELVQSFEARRAQYDADMASIEEERRQLLTRGGTARELKDAEMNLSARQMALQSAWLRDEDAFGDRIARHEWEVERHNAEIDGYHEKRKRSEQPAEAGDAQDEAGGPSPSSPPARPLSEADGEFRTASGKAAARWQDDAQRGRIVVLDDPDAADSFLSDPQRKATEVFANPETLASLQRRAPEARARLSDDEAAAAVTQSAKGYAERTAKLSGDPSKATEVAEWRGAEAAKYLDQFANGEISLDALNRGYEALGIQERGSDAYKRVVASARAERTAYDKVYNLIQADTMPSEKFSAGKMAEGLYEMTYFAMAKRALETIKLAKAVFDPKLAQQYANAKSEKVREQFAKDTAATMEVADSLREKYKRDIDVEFARLGLSDEQADRIRFEASLEAVKDRKMGLSENLAKIGNNAAAYLPFIGAFHNIDQTAVIAGIATKMQLAESRGEDLKLSDSEAQIVHAWLDAQRRDKTMMAKVADVVAEIPSFGVEIGTTAGLYTGAKKLAQEGLEHLASKTVQKLLADKLADKVRTKAALGWTKNLAVKAVSGTAGTLAVTPLVQGDKIAVGTFERMHIPSLETLGDYGDVTEWLASPGTPALQAFSREFLDSAIEYGSERLGGALFDPAFAKLTPFLKERALRLGMVQALCKANPGKSPNAALSFIRRRMGGFTGEFAATTRRMGIDSIGSELLEERAGDLMRQAAHALTEGYVGEEWRMPSREDMMVEFIAIAGFGGAIGAINETNLRITDRNIRKSWDKAAESGRAALDTTDPAELAKAVQQWAPDVPMRPEAVEAAQQRFGNLGVRSESDVSNLREKLVAEYERAKAEGDIAKMGTVGQVVADLEAGRQNRVLTEIVTTTELAQQFDEQQSALDEMAAAAAESGDQAGLDTVNREQTALHRASAAIKIGMGRPMEELSSAEQQAISEPMEDGTPAVDLSGDVPIVSDAARDEAILRFPAAAEFLRMSETQARQKFSGAAAAATPAQVPANQTSQTSQAGQTTPSQAPSGGDWTAQSDTGRTVSIPASEASTRHEAEQKLAARLSEVAGFGAEMIQPESVRQEAPAQAQAGDEEVNTPDAPQMAPPVDVHETAQDERQADLSSTEEGQATDAQGTSPLSSESGDATLPDDADAAIHDAGDSLASPSQTEGRGQGDPGSRGAGRGTQVREGVDPRGVRERAAGFLRAVLPELSPSVDAALAWGTEVAPSEIAAVAAGRKPVFHEHFGEAAAPALAKAAKFLAKIMPEGVHVEAFDGHLIVVDTAAAGAIAGTTDAEATMEAVREAARNDHIGEFLGYGLAHWSEPGAVPVELRRPDGSLVAGFVARGESAEAFAAERAQDYADALGVDVSFHVGRPDVAPASQNADAGLNSQEELNRGKPASSGGTGSNLAETPPSAPLRPEEGGGINPTHVAKMRDSIRKAMGRLGPSAFPKGYAYTLLEHGGGLAYQEGKLLIDLNRLHGTLRNAGAKRIEAAVVEEYIHHLTTTEFQHGELEALWQRMPDSLKQTVRNAYFAAEIAAGAPIPADVDTPFNMGHEFLRMVIQDKAFAGTITESVNVPKSFVAELIRLLKQLARRLKGEIAKAPQAVREDIQNYVDKILTRINTLDAGAATMSSRPSGRGGSAVEVGATARQGTVTASEPSSARPVESLTGDGIALGSAGTVHTGMGEPIEFTWAAVEAGRLVVSNHDDGSPNAAYDQSLQGRNRNTAASELNVQDIANNTTFSRLSESGETSGGAPIVGPDLQVESGNGRTMGIRRAYSRKLPNVAGYKADLVANAGRFGLDSEAIAAMEAPVLVRIRRSEVDRVAFAEDANRATVSQMSAREVALQDLANLPDGVFGSLDVSEDGDIYTPANEGFFRRFFQSAVTPGELPALIDANGRLTQQGLDRMRNALFVAAYGSNESGMLAFARMAENPAPEFRNLVKAMMGAAPQFAQVNSMIGAGALPDLSISGDVAAAANAFVELRRRGESVQDYLDQGQLVADGVTPFQRELLSWIDSSLRAPRKMAETLGSYATLLSRQDNPGQGQLFEAEPASKEQLWGQAKAADGPLDHAEGMLFSASPIFPEQDSRHAELERRWKGGDQAAYDEAVEMAEEAMTRKGYSVGSDFRMAHSAPDRENESLSTIKEGGVVPDDYWTHPHWYAGTPEELVSHSIVSGALMRLENYRAEGKKTVPRIEVFRAVAKNVKEGMFRNGDWVSPSERYARMEGESIPGGYRIVSAKVPLDRLWWDGNSIAELGYDDGKSYAYRNTKNNRKSTEPFTYDADGKLIPLSKRFNQRNASTLFSSSVPDLSSGAFANPPSQTTFVEDESGNHDGRTKAGQARSRMVEGVRVLRADAGWLEHSEVRSFEERTGSRVQFYSKPGERHVAGYTDVRRGTENLIFVNVEANSPLGNTLAHEWGHLASHDPDSGFAELEGRVHSLLTPEEVAVIEDGLRESGYRPDQFRRETTTFLIGDALGGTDLVGLSHLSRANEIRDAIRQFYNDAPPLNPSSLVQSAEDDLARRKAVQLADAMLAKLPVNARSVVAGVAEGRDFHDIGEEVGLSAEESEKLYRNATWIVKAKLDREMPDRPALFAGDVSQKARNADTSSERVEKTAKSMHMATVPSAPLGDRSLPPVELTLEGWSGSAADLSRLARDVYTRELQGTSVMNADMGESVAFTSEGKSEAFGARGKMRVPVRAELVKVLRDLVGSAVKVAESPPAKGRESDSKGFRTLVAPMSVNSNLFAVKVTVRVPRKDGAGLKFYDVTTAEMQRGPDVNGVGEEASLRPSPFGASGPTVAELASVFNIDLPGTALHSASTLSPEDGQFLDDVRADLQTRAEAEQRAVSDYDAVALAYAENLEIESIERLDEEAALRIKHDRAGEILRLMEIADSGAGIHERIDVRVAMMLLPDLHRAAVASRDLKKLGDVQSLFHAFRKGATEAGRNLNARRFSPFRSVAETNLHFLHMKLSSIPKRWEQRINDALTPSEKRRKIKEIEDKIKERMAGPGAKPESVRQEVARLAQELARRQAESDRSQLLAEAMQDKLDKLEASLVRDGISLVEVFNGDAVVKLRSGAWLKKQLERYSQTERKAIRAMVNGHTPKEIHRESGIALNGIEPLRKRFADHMREEFGRLVDSGVTLADFDGGLGEAIGGVMDASGRLHSASVSPADTKAAEEAQEARKRAIRQFESALGLTDAQWDAQKKGRTRRIDSERSGKPREKGKDSRDDKRFAKTPDLRFDPDNRGHVLKISQKMDETGGSTVLDKMYEYWIAGILSGPQTHVVNVAGNALNMAFEYGAQRWMEAAINSLPGMRDPNGATFKEFRWMAKALKNATKKAWRMSLVSFNSELEIFESDVLNESIEYVASKAEHRKFAIPAKWGGKKIRVSLRLLKAADTFFKYLAGTVEASAQAYRIANSEGLRGSALDERIHKLVNTAGSPAWQQAVPKTQELTFTSPLRSAADGGGTIESLVRRLQDWRTDDSGTFKGSAGAFMVGLVFPFVQTPYNVFRTGLRRTPFAALPVVSRMLKAGLYRVKDGKPFFESYEKALFARDMVDQFMAWSSLMLLMGLVEGDDDDDEKPILLTGSRPYGIEQGGDREHLDRLHGGAFQLRIGKRGPDAVYIDIGRLEPLVTSIGTVADMIRGIKRVQHGKPWMDETGKLFSYMLDQAQEKTFLQGFASIAEWLQNPEKRAGGLPRVLLQSIVPNFVRQPLRNLDDYARDSKTAPLYYHALPYGGWAQPKLDLWGNPIEKAGNPVARVFVDVGLQPYGTPVRGDELIRNWNRENPDDPFFPTPTRADTWQDAMKRTHKMTPEQRQEFLRRVGETFERKVRMEISPAEARNPSEQIKNKMKQLRDAATSEVKRQMVASGLLRPAA